MCEAFETAREEIALTAFERLDRGLPRVSFSRLCAWIGWCTHGSWGMRGKINKSAVDARAAGLLYLPLEPESALCHEAVAFMTIWSLRSIIANSHCHSALADPVDYGGRDRPRKSAKDAMA
jgi:hypothetical protein